MYFEQKALGVSIVRLIYVIHFSFPLHIESKNSSSEHILSCFIANLATMYICTLVKILLVDFPSLVNSYLTSLVTLLNYYLHLTMEVLMFYFFEPCMI